VMAFRRFYGSATAIFEVIYYRHSRHYMTTALGGGF